MREIIIKEFMSMVKTVAAGKTVGELFTKLRRFGLNKLELMIVDSAIKYSRLETLYRTLLVGEDMYYEMLQSLTYKLYNATQEHKI